MTRMHAGASLFDTIYDGNHESGYRPRAQEIAERTRQHKRPATEKTRLAESTAVVWHVGLPVVFRG